MAYFPSHLGPFQCPKEHTPKIAFRSPRRPAATAATAATQLAPAETFPKRLKKKIRFFVDNDDCSQAGARGTSSTSSGNRTEVDQSLDDEFLHHPKLRGSILLGIESEQLSEGAMDLESLIQEAEIKYVGRRVQPGEVKLVTIKSPRASPSTTPKRQCHPHTPLPTPPASVRCLQSKTSNCQPTDCPANDQRWSLPTGAKHCTMHAIQQIDNLYSQVAILKNAEQRERITTALQRTKAALMKKLGARSFEEYSQLEGHITRELKMVQMAQAELLAKRDMELEGEGGEDEGKDKDEDRNWAEVLADESSEEVGVAPIRQV